LDVPIETGEPLFVDRIIEAPPVNVHRVLQMLIVSVDPVLEISREFLDRRDGDIDMGGSVRIGRLDTPSCRGWLWARANPETAKATKELAISGRQVVFLIRVIAGTCARCRTWYSLYQTRECVGLFAWRQFG
jgi:hypothetical protein